MIVELKKIKITKGVLSQLQYGSSLQMINYEVMGWYINSNKGKKYKYILLYSGHTNSLVYVCYPSKIEVRHDESNTYYYVAYISDYGLTEYKQTDDSSIENANKYCNGFLEMKHKADRIGQIFY